MRKIIAIVFSLLVFSFSIACSSNSVVYDDQTKQTASEFVTSNSGLQINASQVDNLGKSKNEFDVTTEDLIKAIDKSLKNARLQILSDQTPKVEDYNDNDMGNVNENQYDLGNGILLSLYCDKANKKVTGLHFFIDTSNANAESIKYYSICADATIHYLDSGNADKIENTLNLRNIETNESHYFDSEKYSYLYDVRDGTDVLMVKLHH